MKHLGTIDWDETYGSFQFKLGYCQCGKKILATRAEVGEIAERFHDFKPRRSWKRRIYGKVRKYLEEPEMAV